MATGVVNSLIPDLSSGNAMRLSDPPWKRPVRPLRMSAVLLHWMREDHIGHRGRRKPGRRYHGVLRFDRLSLSGGLGSSGLEVDPEERRRCRSKLIRFPEGRCSDAGHLTGPGSFQDGCCLFVKGKAEVALPVEFQPATAICSHHMQHAQARGRLTAFRVKLSQPGSRAPLWVPSPEPKRAGSHMRAMARMLRKAGA